MFKKCLERLDDHIFSKLYFTYGTSLSSFYGLEITLFFFCYFLGLFSLSSTFLAVIFFVNVPVGTFHSLMVYFLAKKEIDPCGLLYHQHTRTRVFFSAGLVFLVSLTVWLLLDPYLSEASFDQAVALLIGLVAWISFSLASSSLPYCAYLFSFHKEARLCFKLILSTFEGVLKEERGRSNQLVHKKLRWFKRAFDSCNSFLVETPYSIELNNKGEYSDAIYAVALMGSPNEIEQMSKNVESALASLGLEEKDVNLRQFIVSLGNVIGKKYSQRSKPEKSLADLSDLWKTSSLAERVKSRMKSPFVPIVVGIIALAFALINVLLQFWKLFMLP